MIEVKQLNAKYFPKIVKMIHVAVFTAVLIEIIISLSNLLINKQCNKSQIAAIEVLQDKNIIS